MELKKPPKYTGFEQIDKPLRNFLTPRFLSHLTNKQKQMIASIFSNTAKHLRQNRPFKQPDLSSVYLSKERAKELGNIIKSCFAVPKNPEKREAIAKGLEHAARLVKEKTNYTISIPFHPSMIPIPEGIGETEKHQ